MKGKDLKEKADQLNFDEKAECLTQLIQKAAADKENCQRYLDDAEKELQRLLDANVKDVFYSHQTGRWDVPK